MNDQINEVVNAANLGPVKSSVEPIEIYRRNIRTMSNRRLSSHLRRKTRQQGSMMDATWSIILSTVFDSTKTTGDRGKLAPYLR